MKKILSIISILIISFILVSCTQKKTRLDPPTNLRIENKVLYWDIVNQATKYEIYINNEMYAVETNYFNISFSGEGEYEIRVKALASDYIASYLSSPIYYTNVIDLTVPSNVKIIDKDLVWDYIKHATSYTVLINGQTYNTDRNVFDLSFLETNKFYDISVRANYHDKSSEYSTAIKYNTFYNTYKKLIVAFNRNSSEDLVIDLEESLTIESIQNQVDVVVDDEYYQVKGESLIFSNSYLINFDYGLYKYVLYTDKGIILLEIKITDNRNPYMISNNNVVFNNEDLVFEFELYGGFIETITISEGDEITENDYKIEGSKLIINSEFIESIFAKSNQRLSIVFNYQLRNDDKIVIGQIIVSRE